jgi:uncharacterized membrane protein
MAGLVCITISGNGERETMGFFQGEITMEKATFGLDENVASAACYVLGWVSGIIFFLMEKDNKTVRFHAMQSILTFLPLTILIWVVNAIFFGAFMFGMWGVWGLVITLIEIVLLILWLFLMIKAYQGEKFKVPVVGDIAENQVK